MRDGKEKRKGGQEGEQGRVEDMKLYYCPFSASKLGDEGGLKR